MSFLSWGPRDGYSTPGGVSPEWSSGTASQNPQSAGHNASDADQDMVGILNCCTLLGHAELLVHQLPQVLLLRTVPNSFSAQPLLVLGTAPTQVQHLTLGLVDLHGLHMGAPLKPIQVSLHSILSLQHVNSTTKLGVISKFTEQALNPTVMSPARC